MSIIFSLCTAAAVLLHTTEAVGWEEATALEEYVFSDDGAYSYEEITAYTYSDATVYIYNMTSQIWLDETWTDRPLWWHILVVAIPNNMKHLYSGYLSIEGNDNDPNWIPGKGHSSCQEARKFAVELGIPAAVIHSVPNQPIRFADDWQNRNIKGNALIGWSFRRYKRDYMQGQADPNYLALFPMVKAAKRGLDAIADIAKEKEPTADISRFAVAGTSKRGWTAFLLAGVDARVTVLVPTAYSQLNYEEVLMHHYQSLGGWSFALFDFWKHGFTFHLLDPVIESVASYIDPYSYRERLTMPKLISMGTNDVYFLVDEIPLWINGVPGPTYSFMRANDGHNDGGNQGENVLLTFIRALLEDYELPEISWTVGSDNTNGWIEMTTNLEPEIVRAYVADTLPTNNRRDFRSDAGFPPESQNIVWTEADFEDMGDGDYRVSVEYPPDGQFRGFFFEATWPDPQREDREVIFTTEVFIIPEELPFSPCEDRLECLGRLL